MVVPSSSSSFRITLSNLLLCSQLFNLGTSSLLDSSSVKSDAQFFWTANDADTSAPSRTYNPQQQQQPQQQPLLTSNKHDAPIPIMNPSSWSIPPPQYLDGRNLQPADTEEMDSLRCEVPIQFDPTLGHKEVYTVGVLAIRGFDDVYAEFNATFNSYLTETAGKRFDPPIRFELKPLDFVTLFTEVEQQTVDYIHVNPSAFSCIESEYEAHSLVSQVSRRNVAGNVYDLKKFGGVIAALSTREDIQTIYDLKDKVIAAASISGLGSGQMQFKQMIDNGMDYLMDPKQIVFTSDQDVVVKGLLNGNFDVGFVRTDQLEQTVDENGISIDRSIFKVIDPQPNLTIDGEPFPFQSSTELYAEWNVAGLTHVSPDVSREVQRAMLDITQYAKIGSILQECYDSNATTKEECDAMELYDLYDDPVACSATHSVVIKALQAQTNGKYAGWTTSLSYMQLRSMQEAIGFISMEPETKVWRCVRSTELYDGITCPTGYFRKTREEVENGCQEAGMDCQDGYQCVCRPCEKPFALVCVDSVMISGKCVSLGVFLPSIIIPVVLLVGIVVQFYVEYKRRQSDAVWVVKPEELEFDVPPTKIGQGTFGLVLLAEYRGTRVAVKRVIPPSAANTNSLFDVSTTSSDITHSGAMDGGDIEIGSGYLHPGTVTLGPGELKQHLRRSMIAPENESGAKSASRGWLKRCWDRDEDTQARLKAEFVSEIRQLARLRHPCITTVMGAVMPTRQDEPMLVMEYMSYGSLHDVLQDEAIILKPEQILAILQDVAQGLRFLHSASPQVVHGDLKAQNVLVDANFCAKVTDFGLSGKKQIGAVGTPYWMSPELLCGEAINSTASDIYAFGMVIYESYSGRAPYEGERYDQVVRDICDPLVKKRPPIPLSCPAKVAKLMTDCFLHDPIERPTAAQLDLALKVELKVKERTSRLEALNKELELANRKIASASALQLQHFACMSHEIRTPLNCIIGISSLLEDTDLNAMQKESMEMIVSSGKLLRQIVDDVLDYSKLESGNVEVLVKEANLQETVNAVIHLIKTSRVTVQKDLKIETTYDPLLPETIQADSRRIQQILYNLLGNAIKFSVERSTIEFGIRIVAGSILRFSVKDYGKGIAESDYDKIFEPFRQTETGLTNAAGGTGLGLAITKKLVGAMGGNITVESKIGDWTKFTVDFPFTDTLVDISDLSAKLNATTILFVANEEDPDTERVADVFDMFNVKLKRFNSMRDLAPLVAAEKGLSTEGAYICLSHEDLCDSETYELLAANTRSCLVTFGPHFRIEKAKKHWRSLVDTFPSVLISTLGLIAEEITKNEVKVISAESNEQKGGEYEDLRILIAEDNLVNQKVLTRMLHRLGVVSVTIANNGLEAVEKESQEAFDLILMDMQMPKMDGIEACREVNKRRGGHPLAKVVFVTAHVSDTFRQTCLENGAIGYLPKPCTVKAVNEILQHAVGIGSMFSAEYNASWNHAVSPATTERIVMLPNESKVA